MSQLKAKFDAAAKDVTKLDEAPDNNTKLKLYALYKQASSGDISGSRPGILDPVGRAKFDAWEKMKGLKKEDAMKQYVDLVEKLKNA